MAAGVTAAAVLSQRNWWGRVSQQQPGGVTAAAAGGQQSGFRPYAAWRPSAAGGAAQQPAGSYMVSHQICKLMIDPLSPVLQQHMQENTRCVHVDLLSYRYRARLFTVTEVCVCTAAAATPNSWATLCLPASCSSSSSLWYSTWCALACWQQLPCTQSSSKWQQQQ